MGAEIKSFPGVLVPDAALELQPVAYVIKELELLLAEARTGKLRAIAVATVRVGGVVGRLWVRPENGGEGHSLAAAIGGLHFGYFADRESCSRPVDEDASA